jgi:hypothetical protein
MRAAVVAALLAGCSFQAGPFVAATSDSNGPLPDTGDTPDADPDAMPDVMPDVMIDAIVTATTDHAVVADTFLGSGSYANTNFSTQASALVDGTGNECVVLMRFDLSSIAATAVVTGAELHIWTDYDPGAAVTLYPLLESWTESSTTWNDRSTGVTWSTAGAAPPSRGTNAVGTVTPSTASTEYTIAISTATVAGWVAQPGTNFGLAFVTTDSDGTRFSTRDHATTTRHPFLRVTHAP